MLWLQEHKWFIIWCTVLMTSTRKITRFSSRWEHNYWICTQLFRFLHSLSASKIYNALGNGTRSYHTSGWSKGWTYRQSTRQTEEYILLFFIKKNFKYIFIMMLVLKFWILKVMILPGSWASFRAYWFDSSQTLPWTSTVASYRRKITLAVQTRPNPTCTKYIFKCNSANNLLVFFHMSLKLACVYLWSGIFFLIAKNTSTHQISLDFLEFTN